jgi:hypothetical protein
VNHDNWVMIPTSSGTSSKWMHQTHVIALLRDLVDDRWISSVTHWSNLWLGLGRRPTNRTSMTPGSEMRVEHMFVLQVTRELVG